MKDNVLYSYTKSVQEDIILLTVSPMPDWQDFEQFVSFFLQQEGAVVVAQDYGVDRHQVRYRVGNRQYILQYEHYTESVWVENDF